MTEIAYTVTCTISYPSKEKEWLAWITGGHIADVLKAGASAAELIKHDAEETAKNTVTYEIRYKFKDRGSFEEYLEKHAPRLRREGLEKFPHTDGFKYHRTSGEILKV